MQFNLIKYLRRINKGSIFKILIFLPLLIYLGNRSLIAYDEGFYALQAKWILNNNNWITPTWWGQISLDRTIGIQALIAFSQKIFGPSTFSIYIPNIIASFFMLFFTYALHKEFFGNKYSLASPLILSTTLLWINYSHLATQDIIYSSLITLGIYSSVKFLKGSKNTFLILSAIWIGFAFMMKTSLTFIPFLAILPLFLHGKFFYKKLFWVGLIIGFIPFLLWSFKVVSVYGFFTYSDLFRKLFYLSSKNPFTNPFYYYLWNLPLNIFPWSFLALIGFISSLKIKKFTERYILFFYPLIIIMILSFFSTKTPYYPIQILSILSLNTFNAMSNIIWNKTVLNKIISYFNFYLVPSFLIVVVLYLNSEYSKFIISSNDKLIISLGILFLSIFWLSISLLKSNKNKIIFALLGPYILTCILVQSGTLSDRAKEYRIAAENLIKKESLENNKIEVIKSDINSSYKHSKIIKISLLMPNIGNGLKEINELKKNQYAWTTNTDFKLDKKNKVKIIEDSEIFSPWILVQRED
tara:strand:- start:169 stop:1743 length:1575 start_codon:yes stop_codon:yes gene_type:complete